MLYFYHVSFFPAPPVTIEIIGHENNSKFDVRENSPMKLQCLAKGSKPAAKIVWFRGQNELKPSK